MKSAMGWLYRGLHTRLRDSHNNASTGDSMGKRRHGLGQRYVCIHGISKSCASQRDAWGWIIETPTMNGVGGY